MQLLYFQKHDRYAEKKAPEYSVLTYYCFPRKPTLTYAKKSKALVASEVNPLLITKEVI